jgi:hypothetical protein
MYEKFLENFEPKNLTDHLKDLHVDGMIILKLIFKEIIGECRLDSSDYGQRSVADLVNTVINFLVP